MIELAPYVDKKIRVKFVGGREVTGILKGADPICNLVLDDASEYLRGTIRLYILQTAKTHTNWEKRKENKKQITISS